MQGELVGKRERNKRANRAAILEAARQVFMTRGYDAVTIRDIIRATPLAAGTFYNYFPDKESLFRTLVEERMFLLTARVSAVRRSATSLETFVLNAYRTAFEEICSDRELFQLIWRNEQKVRSLYDGTVFGDSIRSLKTDLLDAVDRGLLPPGNIDYLAAVLFGAAYEMSRQLLEGDAPDPDRAARFTAEVFLRGLVPALRPESASLIRKGPIKLKGAAR